MDAIVVLRREHKWIKSATDLLDLVVQQSLETIARNTNDLESLMDFFITFADGCHHVKEEGIFFPALSRSRDPLENGIITKMLLEHVKARAFVKGMKSSLAGVTKMECDAYKNFKLNARKYISLVRRHIDVEDKILFSSAREELSQEKLESMVFDFDQIDTRMLENRKLTEYWKMLGPF